MGRIFGKIIVLRIIVIQIIIARVKEIEVISFFTFIYFYKRS